MFTLLTVLHTKQVWTALIIGAIGLILMITRPVSVQLPSIPQGDGLSATDRAASTIAFDRINAMLEGSSFYVPRSADSFGTVDSDRSGTSASMALVPGDPILRAIATRNDIRTAYFALGDKTQAVTEGEALQDWTVTQIDPTSVLFVKDGEFRRLYMYEQLVIENE